ISMVSMLVYGIGNNNQFTISKEYEFGELEHGKTKDIKYTIIPNPIKFKDSVEKDVVLVLDTSQTVNQKQKAIKDSANQFVEKFLTDNNSKNFKLGIVSYNEKAEMVQELTKNKENLKTAIDNIYSDSNIYSWLTNGNHLGTNVGDAFRLAISMLGKDVDANKEKIVIFMSNGKPNAYTGKFYKGPESTISKEKISSLNRYEQRLYEITSLNGNEDGLGKESLSQEEVAMNNKIKDYEKYFYDPESLDDYRKQDFQKRGLRSDKVNNLIWNEYGISHANSYINEIYKGKSTYSVNVLPNKDDGENIISYYMGSEIGYAYSLKMAKEMKDLGISTYPIYFDNDGNSNNERNNDTRENTMKLISKFAGNEERNGVTSVNTVHSNDITASLNDVFTNLDKNIKDSYSVNDAKLTINIPEGLEIESINYSGKTIKINKEDLKDGKYQLPLNNLSYKLDERDRIYIYDGKPLEISVTVRGINTSGSDKNCSITGDVYSKSIEDSKKADLPNINIKVKSGIKVEITVNDFIGNVGEKYDSTYINPENNSFNFIKEPKRLIGDGNADISVNGIQEKSNEEYWIKTWFTKENS
ncbi:vWA domain-containing protein, partial [Clostridium perfringens]